MNKETKHAPEQWEIKPAKGTLCAWLIESKSPYWPTVAFVAQTIGDNQVENARAAKIAAAPEMLEALKEIADGYRADDKTPQDTVDRLRQVARAAISKAKGK